MTVYKGPVAISIYLIMFQECKIQMVVESDSSETVQLLADKVFISWIFCWKSFFENLISDIMVDDMANSMTDPRIKIVMPG